MPDGFYTSVHGKDGSLHRVDKKDHFPTMHQLLDRLVSPPADSVRSLAPTRSETTFFSRGYRFDFTDPEGREAGQPEYCVTGIDEAEMVGWCPFDEPSLVFELISIERESDGFHVTRKAMSEFLESYGPLTASFARSASDLASCRGRNSWSDPRNDMWMYRFSPLVDELNFVTETLQTHGRSEAVAACLWALDRSPSDSLHRALVLQLLVGLLEAPLPRPCAGCGKWFRETEDASMATHRQGWKRHDAKYHRAGCGKASRERARRARRKQREGSSAKGEESSGAGTQDR